MFEASPQPRIHLNTHQGEADIYVEDRRLCGEIHVSQTYLSERISARLFEVIRDPPDVEVYSVLCRSK